MLHVAIVESNILQGHYSHFGFWIAVPLCTPTTPAFLSAKSAHLITIICPSPRTGCGAPRRWRDSQSCIFVSVLDQNWDENHATHADGRGCVVAHFLNLAVFREFFNSCGEADRRRSTRAVCKFIFKLASSGATVNSGIVREAHWSAAQWSAGECSGTIPR